MVKFLDASVVKSDKKSGQENTNICIIVNVLNDALPVVRMS